MLLILFHLQHTQHPKVAYLAPLVYGAETRLIQTQKENINKINYETRMTASVLKQYPNT